MNGGRGLNGQGAILKSNPTAILPLGSRDSSPSLSPEPGMSNLRQEEKKYHINTLDMQDGLKGLDNK